MKRPDHFTTPFHQKSAADIAHIDPIDTRLPRRTFRNIPELYTTMNISFVNTILYILTERMNSDSSARVGW